jgi:hypothetical protein
MLMPVRYRNKETQSSTGMLQYWAKIQDAGMPMPAASTSMPMPSYDYYSEPVDVMYIFAKLGQLL